MTVVAQFGRDPADVRVADCDVSVEVGDFVYVVGDPIGGRDQVSTADPSDYDMLPAVGVVIDKLTATMCNVMWRGETPDIFTGLATGEIYFLGVDGMASSLPPDVVPGGMFVQVVGVATAPERMYIRIENTLTKRVA